MLDLGFDDFCTVADLLVKKEINKRSHTINVHQKEDMRLN